MRFGKATPDGSHLLRPSRLPRVRPPKLHQPKVHVTAMVGAAALVSVFAAATPALHGSFVGGNTAAAPVGSVSSQGADAPSAASVPAVPGEPSFTTVVTPPADAVVRTGAGNVATVQYAAAGSAGDLASPLAGDGIPVTALEAYQHAAITASAGHPNCHIPWPLLAGIGRVESDHGRYGGAVLRPDGTSTRPIIGIPLNGHGTEVVTDTDGGSIDGDPVFDRAVGPMQFIPSTWGRYGADGNGDGIKDPFNIFDAALAAADYLCVAGGNLSTTAGQTRAVLTYNHSTAYLDEVLALEHAYASGEPGLIVPTAPVVVPPVPVQHPGGRPVPPPADPGPPLGLGSDTKHHHKHHHKHRHHGTTQDPTSAAPSGGTTSSTPADPATSAASSSTTNTTAPGTGPGTGTSGDPSGSSGAPSCATTSTGSAGTSDTATSAANVLSSAAGAAGAAGIAGAATDAAGNSTDVTSSTSTSSSNSAPAGCP